MPNFLGTESSFTKEFAKPITKGQSSNASAVDINHGIESLKILHQQVLPFVLRREKSQVMKELPPKIITDVPCLLSGQQRAMYQQTLRSSGMKEALEFLERSLAGTECSSALDTPGVDPLPKFESSVLASLLQLRLICTHPLLHSLFSWKTCSSSSGSSPPSSLTRLDCSGKLSVLSDILRHAGVAEAEITAADNDHSGFFFDVTDDESLISSDLENGCVDISDEPPELQTTSLSSSSKCLIFAQFTQSLDVVERLLFEPHMPSLQYLRLDGRVPSSRRSSVVDEFNQNPDVKVLLLTTKVGGLGLNLTGESFELFRLAHV